MPLLKVNVIDRKAVVQDGETLSRALAQLPADAPIVICIHGFKFSPDDPENSPHSHILSLDPRADCWKAMSWPRALGFTRQGGADEGLCVAFGWNACGTVWQAWSAAEAAGEALAGLIARMDRPVHVVAHSMGARVALRALHHLSGGQVARMILLAGAEFRATARAALDTQAGQGAQVINITSRENDLYDLILEKLVRDRPREDRTLGAGLGRDRAPNWVDIQIDDGATLRALSGLGFAIAAPERRICHWSAYLRRGLFPFYTALLRAPERLPMGVLQAAIPCEASPRWSRLIGPSPFARPLSFARKATF